MTHDYKLLTPGPLTTTQSVKNEMLEDRCTWDNAYKDLTQSIRQKLLDIAEARPKTYTTVLQQGSGSFVVESVLQTALSEHDHILIISNGAYGNRMIEMAQRLRKQVTAVKVDFHDVPNFDQIEAVVQDNPSITHIAMVHCETTTGILNPLVPLTEIAEKYHLMTIVDAMSSFGGIPIQVEQLNIDYLISSANKCIQGVPGFGFVIAKQASLSHTKGNAQSLVLDLYDQWQIMEQDDGKWRYTSPTHVVAAFHQALVELDEEGGVDARHQRYQALNEYLRAQLAELGFKPYIDANVQSPIITTFLYPYETFDFNDFYRSMKQAGFILYPGKLMETPSFRIGNIGDLDMDELRTLVENIRQYLLKEEL
ncbi:2-aminoethylphosphonate--pyruvate transaminase [Staphylococcus simulans]